MPWGAPLGGGFAFLRSRGEFSLFARSPKVPFLISDSAREVPKAGLRLKTPQFRIESG